MRKKISGKELDELLSQSIARMEQDAATIEQLQAEVESLKADLEAANYDWNRDPDRLVLPPKKPHE